MGQTTPAPAWRQELQKTLELVRTLRDDIRVRLHLANLDAKEEWKKLEPHLAELEQAAAGLREDTRAALSSAVERLSRLRSSLGEPAAQGRARSQEPDVEPPPKH